MAVSPALLLRDASAHRQVNTQPFALTLTTLKVTSVKIKEGLPNPQLSFELEGAEDVRTTCLFNEACPTWDALHLQISAERLPELTIRLYDISSASAGRAERDQPTLLAWARMSLLDLLDGEQFRGNGRIFPMTRDGIVSRHINVELHGQQGLPDTTLTFSAAFSNILLFRLHSRQLQEDSNETSDDGRVRARSSSQMRSDSTLQISRSRARSYGSSVRREGELQEGPSTILVIGSERGPKKQICQALARRSGGSVISIVKLLLVEIITDSSKGKVLREIVEKGEEIGSDERIALLRQAMRNRPPPYLLFDFPQSEIELAAFEREAGPIALGVRVTDVNRTAKSRRQSTTQLPPGLLGLALALGASERLKVVLGSQSLRNLIVGIVDELHDRGFASFPYDLPADSINKAVADSCHIWLKNFRMRALCLQKPEFTPENRAARKSLAIQRRSTRNQISADGGTVGSDASFAPQSHNETVQQRDETLPECLQGTAIKFLSAKEAEILMRDMEKGDSMKKGLNKKMHSAYIASHSPGNPLKHVARHTINGTRVGHPMSYLLDSTDLISVATPKRQQYQSWHRHLPRRSPSKFVGNSLSHSVSAPSLGREKFQMIQQEQTLRSPDTSGAMKRRPSPVRGSRAYLLPAVTPQSRHSRRAGPKSSNKPYDKESLKWVEKARSLREAIAQAAKEGAPDAAAKIATLLGLKVNLDVSVKNDT